MQARQGQGSGGQRAAHVSASPNPVAVTSDTSDMATRLAALEARVQSLSWETSHLWNHSSETRTEHNREVGARHIRHENIRRDVGRWSYGHDKLKEDYYRLREDFDDLLAAIEPVLAGGDNDVRARSLHTVRNIVRRRRDQDRWGGFDAGDVPSPRPHSPFAVIDAEYNEMFTGANPNAN